MNLGYIKEICSFVYCELPSPSWGSPEKYEKWIEEKKEVENGNPKLQATEGDENNGG